MPNDEYLQMPIGMVRRVLAEKETWKFLITQWRRASTHLPVRVVAAQVRPRRLHGRRRRGSDHTSCSTGPSLSMCRATTRGGDKCACIVRSQEPSQFITVGPFGVIIGWIFCICDDKKMAISIGIFLLLQVRTLHLAFTHVQFTFIINHVA